MGIKQKVEDFIGETAFWQHVVSMFCPGVVRELSGKTYGFPREFPDASRTKHGKRVEVGWVFRDCLVLKKLYTFRRVIR